MGKYPLNELRPAIFLDRDGVINPAVVREGKPYPPPSLGREFQLLAVSFPDACRMWKIGGGSCWWSLPINRMWGAECKIDA